MLHKAIQNRWCRLALAVAATLLYAIGVNWFIVPMGLYTGGLLGPHPYLSFCMFQSPYAHKSQLPEDFAHLQSVPLSRNSGSRIKAIVFQGLFLFLFGKGTTFPGGGLLSP